MVTAERPRPGRSLAGKKLSEAELMALPDDGRKYELVDGRAKEVPTGWEHGRIAIRLINLLLAAGVEDIGALTDSSTGYRLADGLVRVPDVAFVTHARAPKGAERERFFDGAPDLAVEIISPSEDEPDMARKVAEYLASGARQVWQIYPETRRLVVYESLDRVASFAAEEEFDGGDLLPTFRCRAADLMPEE